MGMKSIALHIMLLFCMFCTSVCRCSGEDASGLLLTDLGSAQPKCAVGGRSLYVGPLRGGKWVYCPPEQVSRDP